MNKKKVKTEINRLYKETIAHNELPKEFQEGIKNFKDKIFTYIVSLTKNKIQ